MKQLNCADLFCGAGGTSSGAESTGAARVRFAVNHWSVAVQTHSANFPDAKHVNSRLDQVSPSECPRIDLLFASPECTHHSRARGGRPTSDQQRSGAWDVLKWIEFHRPSWVVIENVREFEHWGPVADNGRPLVSKRGAFFDAWVMAIQAAGYSVDWRGLNAADFGAATSRDRLFVVARKGARRPVFPEPTHTRRPGGELPGLGLPRWRAASEVIDWSIPCPSIFARKRPLAPKTLARIEAGLRRFVGPFVTQWDNQGGGGDYCRDMSGPIGTLVTKANMGLAMPFQVQLRNNCDAADMADPVGTITAGGQHHGVAVPFQFQLIGMGAGRSRPSSDPLPTIVAARENHGVCIPYTVEVNHGGDDQRTALLDSPLGTCSTKNGRGLAMPFLIPYRGERDGQQPRTHSAGEPLPTLTTERGSALTVPFLLHYYGTQNLSPLDEPVDTITTTDRHGVCAAQIGLHNDRNASRSLEERRLRDTMRELGVCDVGFRMLHNYELSAAQGFDSSYVFCGTKSDITRQIGNSVSPPVAAAITRAILGV